MMHVTTASFRDGRWCVMAWQNIAYMVMMTWIDQRADLDHLLGIRVPVLPEELSVDTQYTVGYSMIVDFELESSILELVELKFKKKLGGNSCEVACKLDYVGRATMEVFACVDWVQVGGEILA
ncbi:hypothetical protein ACLOJK_004160 [Asimina triloba]